MSRGATLRTRAIFAAALLAGLPIAETAAQARPAATAAPAAPPAAGAKGAGTGPRLEAVLPPLTALFDAERIAEVRSKGRLARSAGGDSAARPLLAPGHPASAPLLAALREESPRLLVEALFILERPAPASAGGELLRAYARLRDLASLAGVTYYSASRKAMRVLYEESYQIAAAGSRVRIEPGPAPDVIPSRETLYAFQRDTTFGANTYRHELSLESEHLSASVRNLGRMSLGPLPILEPGAFSTRLLVVPCLEGLVVYVASATKSPPPPGLRGSLEESFANRAEALARWFAAGLGLEPAPVSR